MWIFLWCEKGDKNGVRIELVRKNEILISTAGNNWESLSVVSVQFTDVLNADVQFIWLFTWFFGCWFGSVQVTMWSVIRLRFCWSHDLSSMENMSHDSFICWWKKISRIGIGESWSIIVITISNSMDPSVSYPKSYSCMEVPDQGLHNGEVVGTENLQVRPFSVSRYHRNGCWIRA